MQGEKTTIPHAHMSAATLILACAVCSGVISGLQVLGQQDERQGR